MKKFFRFIETSQQLYGISGDFGRVEGELNKVDNGYISEGTAYIVSSKIDKTLSGVISRKDTITNISESSIRLNNASSKFLFDGGEYEVYTQYNGWCNESQGGWQPLISGVTTSVTHLRTSHSAAPIMALWNKQTERGYVFHLLPHSAWEIAVRKLARNDRCFNVEISLGLAGGFSLALEPGDSFTLPEILFYEFQNKTDLDCYKLHEYCLERFPAGNMPVIYNTWLSKFSDITFENVSSQIERAATIGAEYFVIDAGWYGSLDEWSICVGDWTERTRDRLQGRMNEIADLVRKNGMKFGLWLEPERANPECDIVKEHPDYFLREGNNYYLDFNNPDAVDYITSVFDELIKKHGIKFIKFDFNNDLTHDIDNISFVGYYEAYYSFIKMLKKRHPNVYFENCASGGQRINLSNCEDFDGFWYTDNQSAYHSMRIYKDTILRMPPYKMENFATIETRDEFPVYPDKIAPRIFTTDDGAWATARTVSLSFLKAFLTGGCPAFSCDLTNINDETLAELSEIVKEYKRDRNFWKNSTCRILCDTDAMLILQYTDITNGDIKLQAVCKETYQKEITVYPHVNLENTYITTKGETLIGKDIAYDGITLDVTGDFTASEIGLKVK